MQLHCFRLSGHSHRVRLFLSILGLAHQTIEVDLPSRAHKTPAHLRLNPFGQVPVLVDGETVIADSTAILVYLAKRYAPPGWLPDDPAGAARVQRWLSVASGEVAHGLAAARQIVLFGLPREPDEAIARAHATLAVLDAELARQDWLAGEAPSIADLALYAYVERAPEGNVERSAHANVSRWLRRVEALPGFVPFPRSPVGLDAPERAAREAHGLAAGR
ncbi:glutathione S-transferase family protein [Burkholderia plantarii]|uniref:glutathione S-transferase family protein n=1 Tax=Burkholderia plantarii TaxID=41899 RepID=UPI0006D8A527|nr:glutathione S-transferase family protein [Burkholderia plantarii]ALK34858.1 glutathione S-transferase domain-containing protein [Burkholderia plantarii]GLZ18698.1 glutathione S-transferase [Burkholderia plantarii]